MSIMPRAADQLLLPVNPWFLWTSLLVALVLNLLPLGPLPWMPDFLALVLVFWSVHQPRRVGITTAFVLGLLIDVHHGSLLGQHALAYSLQSFFGIAIHRRALWFGPSGQMPQVAPAFFLGALVTLLVRLVAGDGLPGWSFLIAPLAETLLWPVASAVLLAPQRRPPDPDKNRPL
ncbi:rod shape-determining protein MreD [Ideonella sp. B7]|uniref:rod shape-determining protein MreD n=1 Tax=Ideonella benzenivorans TaxID=2831643 RepID=UPI001CECE76E|nr:rod shape-determining protein MreD [Ideonella benzenivorans]MCA6215210.1 rod shape-determining protein MreD [Ideonella benzenivorans]